MYRNGLKHSKSQHEKGKPIYYVLNTTNADGIRLLKFSNVSGRERIIRE